MGNGQSNERKRNYKAYKITQVDEGSSWIRCHLDNYVPYNDGSYKHIYFEQDKRSGALVLGALLFGASDDRPRLWKGSYIAIDIDVTRNWGSGHEFDAFSVKELGFSGSSSGEGGFQGLIGDISEARERYANASEWANFDKSMQQSWQLQPPKK